MTELLEKAVTAIRQMPAEDQDHIAQAMLNLAKIGAVANLNPDDLQDVLEGLAEIDRGEIATDAEVEAAFRSFER